MTQSPKPADLSYFVEGMDCAHCVQGVETMVKRLPGTGEIKASFARQTLELHLDESQTPRTVLEKNLKALGYTPSLQVAGQEVGAVSGEHQHTQTHNHDPNHEHQHDTPPEGQAWYQGAQGRLVLLTGAALLLAWAIAWVWPQTGYYGYALATLLGVWPLLQKALAGARLGNPFSINMLVSLAAIGSLLIGQAAEGVVVVFLFAVGELLEGVAASQARQGIRALAALAPRTATLQEGATLREVSAQSLQVGQVVLVGAGARIPADGVILEGASSLNDSPVTGESKPIHKTVGERVFAGSINGEGTLQVQVDRPSSDNTIARIIRLVEEAEESKAPTARFIDRFSRWYTPGVVLVAALVAVVPPLLGQPWHEWLYKGLALLLIGCPCALVLSVPAALTSAISAGTRHGLLIKGGAVLETLGQVKTVAFDKTGTLTAGNPQVTDIQVLQPTLSPDTALALSAAIETGSAHPLAQAITTKAAQMGLSLPTPTALPRAVAGQGVTAQINGQDWWLSAPKYAPVEPAVVAQMTALEQTGKTVVVLHNSRQAQALLALQDAPRPEAHAALARLQQMGVATLMLTGDNARTAQAIATQLIAPLQVHAELLPQDKLGIIGQLPGPVAFVGDGINDAPALAQADVGIAMGAGTDVALETAGAALLHSNLRGVPDLIHLSKATSSNIKQNIAVALGLKLVFLVTTLLGYTNLWMAVLADTGATALVTANALRLLRWKPQA